MKAKTSITLSQEILDLIDQHVEGESSRSSFIELALRTYLELIKRNKRDAEDLRIIDHVSEKLNREARDVLQYQTEL
ncbi:MAG: ribbon-helix-helix protein, CopG family [Candidatus Eisenbacteria bacterium]|nr:ribbon-helix-helix protein, CopG family [Candidatus Eisenbacteria bacterium]